MEKTYQILLTLNVPSSLDADIASVAKGEPYTNDELTINEAIYSYLEELIEDDSLYFEEMEEMDG